MPARAQMHSRAPNCSAASPIISQTRTRSAVADLGTFFAPNYPTRHALEEAAARRGALEAQLEAQAQELQRTRDALHARGTAGKSELLRDQLQLLHTSLRRSDAGRLPPDSTSTTPRRTTPAGLRF